MDKIGVRPVKKGKVGRKFQHSMAFMRQVVRSIMQENLSFLEASTRYGISHIQARGWYYRFFSDIQVVNPEEIMENTNQPTSEDKKKIEELQKALAEANLKIAGLETMIDIAEQELKTEIRKKSGTKQ